eukprot:COSAG06_NODE_24351_length_665_cov_1.187279_2_plen_54_part_01
MIKEQAYMGNGDTSACFYQLMTQRPAGADVLHPPLGGSTAKRWPIRSLLTRSGW